MKQKVRLIIGIFLFVLCMGASLYGFLFTKEASIVFAKASKICLECIGIG